MRRKQEMHTHDPQRMPDVTMLYALLLTPIKHDAGD